VIAVAIVRVVEVTGTNQRTPVTDTVAALVTEYIAKQVRVKQRGRVEEERIVNVEILPRWNDRSVRDLTRRDVRALVEPIADRGRPIMANRTLAVVRRMLNFGMRRDWLEGNPAALIDKPGARAVEGSGTDRRRYSPTVAPPLAATDDRGPAGARAQARARDRGRSHLPGRARDGGRDQDAVVDGPTRRRSDQDALAGPGPQDRLVDDPRRGQQERTGASCAARVGGDHPPQGPAEGT